MDPVECLATYAIEAQFVSESGVGHFVKCLAEVEEDHVHSSSFRKLFGDGVDGGDQLGLAGASLAKPMLAIRQNLVFLHMSHYTTVNNVFQDLTCNRR